jgi:Zn-dependent protease with chaperone function
MAQPPASSPSATQVAPGAGPTSWSGADRESFFAAVARHRRAAWRVTLASALADTVFALVVAVLMSPLFYAVIALGFDLVNLLHPAPNIVTLLAQVLRPLLDHAGRAVQLRTWLQIGLLAALPGLIWMALVTLMLRRVLRLSDIFNAGELAAHVPDPQVLAEQRFRNVVEEMALAASLPPPSVRVVDDAGLNAAAFGSDEQSVTVMISKGLLERLGREQLQGIAAHLVGSIANGDMKIGLRAATTLSLFAFLARFSRLLGEQDRGRMLVRVCLAMLRPTSMSAQRLTAELVEPSRGQNGDAVASAVAAQRGTKQRTWRDWLWMPLTGPVVITGLLSGFVQMLVLAPLVALAWRQRKYMADATAVRLTRDPDALAGALQALDHTNTAAPFAAWVAHLAVVNAGGAARSPFGGSIVSMYPSLSRRLRALQRMGAHVSYTPRRMPPWLLLVGVPLGLFCGGLMALAVFLLAYVSIPLSALFLGIPFGILHALLRWHSTTL